MIEQKPIVLANSSYWRWRTTYSISTCGRCKALDLRMFEVTDKEQQKPPLHLNCKCYTEIVATILAGTATKQGINGADWHLKHYNCLPEGYITKEDAMKLGWKPNAGNLAEVVPGKMIGGIRYYNFKEILPDKKNRIWYEADINYTKGYRNSERILYSSDGLIFVTYDHGRTFYQIR